MSLPSNGITQNVIREMMPPYYLSADLLEAMFAAMPPPPPDASAIWRQGRITRLMQEFSTLMPANAAQARVASQIMRELADAIAARAFEPELTALQMCRVGRASAELVRTAAGVERLLDRRQQKPAAHRIPTNRKRLKSGNGETRISCNSRTYRQKGVI